ncbi:MAG TPA: hypothetical protein VH134_07685 [Candidatus Dormibacteraeota bacterium]|nr:hypothetical protein [Candidatus Dormibacteraeota bacterium]
MASERWRRGIAALALAGGIAASGPLRVAAEPEPWWVPVGLRGEAVSFVLPTGRGLLVTAAGRSLCLPVPGTSAPASCEGVPGHPAGAAASTGFELHGGRVLHGGRIDPGSPDLGATAKLIAEPAALPGAVVAVAADGTVWRRTAAGAWGRSLLLLPQNLLQGSPSITALTAFEANPLTPAVYLGTDGYAVLVSTDGGDDWFRAAPGLPTGVLALATDVPTRAVYAGTRDGLWVHHLQTIPAPPAYAPSGLWTRWLGIAALTAVATLAALVALGLAAPKATKRPKALTTR